MKALTHGTRICEIADAEFPVHPSLEWVDVPDDTTTKDTYVDGAVVKYTPPVLDPMVKWQSDMRYLDALVTPRMVEDIYEFVVNSTPIPQAVHDAMTARAAKRGQKPE